MHTFFHGWRRKVGTVTLVMAVATFAAWIRSYAISDYILIPLQKDVHCVTIASGKLEWRLERGDELRPSHNVDSIMWSKIDHTRPMAPPYVRYIRFSCYERPHIDWGGFFLGSLDAIIPLWSLTLVLALFSAALLLVPRQTRPSTASKPHA